MMNVNNFSLPVKYRLRRTTPYCPNASMEIFLDSTNSIQ